MSTSKRVATVVVMLVSIVVILVIAAGAPPKAAAVNKPGIFVNVTSGQDNLHSVSMGLALAKASIEHGQKVVVFLNVKAPVFASKSLGNDVKFQDFQPIKGLISDLIAKGATVGVCAHCAKVNGIAQADMLDGIKVFTHDEILGALDSGMVSFTY